MIVRPLDLRAFLGVARVLSAFGEEASFRTAVGRVYYAAFLSARKVAGVTGSHDVHGRVIAALGRVPGREATAFRLNALRRLRVIADYEMLPASPSYRDWPRNWARAEQLANQVLADLESTSE